MRYLALATDYDGTLATHGHVDDATLAALVRLKESGRKLLMVSGRELPDLLSVFPRLDLFDLAVLENGALLFDPATREERCLAEPPPKAFAEELRRRGVPRISEGRVIVATWRPHETTVLETIHELGLELQVIFNKDAVMVLPSGVNKASGLRVALASLGLSPHNAVGVGDAENDHAFLSVCECSVAVANALPVTRAHADLALDADHGAGVRELIARLLDDDLAAVSAGITRHDVLLGRRGGGEELRLPVDANLLVAGTSGGGKSTLATGLLERFAEAGYQFCVVDPEGDYSTLAGALVLGDAHHPPTVSDVADALQQPDVQLVVNLIGIALEHRWEFFASLFVRLREVRARYGRPHWLLIDGAHHVLPWARREARFPTDARGVLLVTVHPQHTLNDALAAVDVVAAIGPDAPDVLREFAQAVGAPASELPASDAAMARANPVESVSTPRSGTKSREGANPDLAPGGALEPGEAWVWEYRAGRAPVRVCSEPARGERRRHRRKHAEGELPPERSFYFRGREGKLQLRAQNLLIFLQLAHGVDDDTWNFHLRGGHVADWFRGRSRTRRWPPGPTPSPPTWRSSPPTAGRRSGRPSPNATPPRPETRPGPGRVTASRVTRQCPGINTAPEIHPKFIRYPGTHAVPLARAPGP